MKKPAGPLIAGLAAAAIAAFCLWYTLVPKSWAGIDGSSQPIALSSISLSLTPSRNDGREYASRSLDADGGHPAAQAVISALEEHAYRADLANLSPVPRDSISAPGTDVLSLMLRTRDKRLMLVTVYSNGQLTTGGLSLSPEGCRSYKTDTGLFQEMLGILQEYGTAE